MSSEVMEFRSAADVAAPLCALYRRYGYAPYKMSKFEEYDLYVKNKSFLLSDHIVTFTDMSGKLMALKPDVTLSIVKNTQDAKSARVYYEESVYRVPKGANAFREIMQVGLERLGVIDSYTTSEVLMLAARSLALLSDDFVLEVSDLGILSAIADSLGLSREGRERFFAAVAQKSVNAVADVISSEGASSVSAEALGRVLLFGGSWDEGLDLLLGVVPEGARTQVEVLRSVLSAVCTCVPKQNVRFDLSVVSDMRYYSGIVFKGYVGGVPQAVLSGGQYDNLMKKMKKDSSALGFAVYPDLLEPLFTAREEYDAEILLLYGEKDSD